MITLLIRAATLEGSANGMYYFIKTDWDKLADADVRPGDLYFPPI